MQHTAILILLIAAAISFALAAFGVPAKVSWVGFGLLLWVLATLIPAVTAK